MSIALRPSIMQMLRPGRYRRFLSIEGEGEASPIAAVPWGNLVDLPLPRQAIH